MAEDIKKFLEGLSLGKYVDVFVENEIDMEAAAYLSEEDLKELGLPMGPRRKFAAAIARGSDPEPFDFIESTKSPQSDKPVEVTGERRQVTALFADISGFTALSSSMDSEETHDMLNGFFTVVDETVHRFGGSIDKHIGDAVMAVFGAPVAHTDDPERALSAAMAIHEAVAELDPPLSVHVGVATGQVVASTTGSANHTEYTVTGDSVNLAARLTDLASPGQTLASGSVQRLLGDRFVGEDLGEQLIKGLPEPIRIWRLDSIAEAQADLRRPFVGRNPERQQFEAAIAQCLEQGAGATMLVSGEAGIGKTRLLEEFERVAREQGFSAHTGLVLDFGTAKGQDAVRTLVRSLLDIAPNDDQVEPSTVLDRVIAKGLVSEERRVYMNDLLGLEQPSNLRALYDAMENATRNWNKQETVAELIRSLSRDNPLLLRIEDLHWADEIVLDYTAHLARSASQCPVLLVMSTRPTGNPVDDNWRIKSGNAQINTLELGPIDMMDASELAKSFEGVSQEVLQNCIERSGGNPLFLEQLLYNADEAEGEDLPGSVQGIVQARLDTLPATDRMAIQAASILGQRFSLNALVYVNSRRDYQPDLLLQQALVRSAGEDYHFAHALIRDAVYASLLKPQRVALHLRAAEYFRDSDPALHAQHLDQAGDPGAAVAYLAAARLQSGAFNFESSLGFAQRGLELESDHATRFELTCFHGDLLRDLGRTAASIEAFKSAVQLAGSDQENCRANLGLAAGMRIAERGDEAMACLDIVEEIANREEGFESTLADSHFLRGNLLFPIGKIEECQQEHETSLRYAIEAASGEREARALGGLGDANYVAGTMHTANQYFSKCISRSVENGLKRIEVSNKPMLAWTELFLNRVPQALETSREAIKEAISIGDRRAEIIGHNLAGEICYMVADYEEMYFHGNRTLEVARSIGATRFEALGLAIQARYEWIVNQDKEKGYATMMQACENCRATAETFVGPWVLGDVAVFSQSQEEREWAIREGKRILDSGALFHNFLFFYRSAMQSCIPNEEWSRLLEFADSLEASTVEAPLGMWDFYAEWGRALAGFHISNRDQASINRLRGVYDKATASGLDSALPPVVSGLTDAGIIAGPG